MARYMRSIPNPFCKTGLKGNFNCAIELFEKLKSIITGFVPSTSVIVHLTLSGHMRPWNIV